MGIEVVGYRPWRGKFHGTWWSPWPVCRIALRMMLRRKVFWVLYLIALFNFMIFFSGIYLLSQIDIEALTGVRGDIVQFWSNMVQTLRRRLYLAGTAETYRNFFWYQGYIVMAVLALAGSVLIGNDYRHGTLPFYLSKPLGRRHYLLGKFLAVAVFINMLTTVPALVMYVEVVLLEGWSYYGRVLEPPQTGLTLLAGIVGYGAVLTVCLGLLVLAIAAWLRKTVPLIMMWVGILFFCRVFANLMVDWLDYHRNWRLIDVWNNMYVIGSWMLATEAKLAQGRRMVVREQPDPQTAAIVLAGICIACLIYLSRRIRAVEVVT